MNEVARKKEIFVEAIWERLRDTTTGRDEPDSALAAFRLYRDLSPASRSLNAVALELHRQVQPQAEEAPRSLVGQVETWSGQWWWLFRTRAWDDEQDRIRCEERRERLRTAVALQKQDSQFASHVLMGVLKKMLVSVQADPTLKGVSDQQLARDAQRVMRAFPELQEAERKLSAQRPKQGPGTDAQISTENLKWEWAGPVYNREEGDGTMKEGREFQGEPGLDEQAEGCGQEQKRAREVLSWRDQLWVRQVDLETGKPEPPRAFCAFTLFRDLPPHQRTLRKVTALSRGTTGTAESGRTPARTRRREHVSATVENWSTKWKWKKRAQAWDDEQDRVRRRAEQKEVERMRLEHGQQLHLARQVMRILIGALSKRVRGAFFAGEEAKLVRCASESIPLIARLQEAERALYGDGTDYEERQTATYEGTALFGWEDVNCACGHPHARHDQVNEDWSIVPCTIEGCACRKFRKPEPEELEAAVVESRGGLPAHLEVASPSMD
jgi:hypothetical protein